jgi:hypothetical protein
MLCCSQKKLPRIELAAVCWRARVLAMKFGLLVLLVLAAVMVPAAARAQAAIYAEFNATQISGAPEGDFLYGGQAGLLVDGPKIYGRVLVQADLQGRFITHSGETLDAGLIGARFSSSPRWLYKVTPFAEFNVGFARFNNGSNFSTTDNLFGVQGGASFPMTAHLDAIADYSWMRYGYNEGLYQPQGFSAGVVYHFVKR